MIRIVDCTTGETIYQHESYSTAYSEFCELVRAHRLTADYEADTIYAQRVGRDGLEDVFRFDA